MFASWYLADLRLDELAGKVGLDAGCGKRRYPGHVARHLPRHLAVLVALDASTAIEVATRDLATFDNVVTVRSDLRSADEAGFFIVARRPLRDDGRAMTAGGALA